MVVIACTALSAGVAFPAGAVAIENGTAVNSGAPWIAYITSRGVGPDCTGALVGKDWVLTAGHCLDPANNQAAVAASMQVTIGRYNLADTSQGASYGLQGQGELDPAFTSKSGSWTNDLALIHLHPAQVGPSPLPLAPTTAALTSAGQGVAFGYGCTAAPVLGACLKHNSQLNMTTTGAFSVVQGGQSSCPAWALCFDQAGNERLWTSDAGGPWAASIGGGLVGLAVTSKTTGTKPQRVLTTPIGASALAWIRSVAGLPTPTPGDIWRDAANRQAWLIDADGFRRLIPDEQTYACLTSKDTTVLSLDPFTVQTAPVLGGVAATCTGGGPASGVAAGVESSCAVLVSGGVDCWGAERLGDGTANPSTTIRSVIGVSGATSVSTRVDDTYHTLKHACALIATGGVDCWGYNAAGQVGDGTTIDRLTAVPVAGISNATQVSAGGDFSCARLSSGQVECWGLDDFGQLGDGNSTGAPYCDVSPYTGLHCSPTPVMVQGISDALAVAAGSQHACALLSSGSVECWGFNGYGQLGDGGNTGPQSCTQAPCSTTPVPVPGLTNVVGLSAGTDFTCAVLASGGIECWGLNGFGNLGDGTNQYGPQLCYLAGAYYECSPKPIPVAGLPGPAVAVSAGNIHACALMSAGGVECWGDNQYGELGDGTISNFYSSTPVAVVGLSGVTAVSAGELHSCAVLSSGGVDCWGLGQLGEWPATDKNPSPVPIAGIP